MNRKRGRKQNFQYMADPRQKFMADVSVVNDVTSLCHLTHGCLKGNPIRAHIL